MQSVDCPFCDHANPSGAKFCNECGSPLHFAPCKQCDAVNHVNDTQCYRCGASLTPPPAPAEAAHLESGVDLEQQVDRLEHELAQIGEEPGPIAEEPEVIDEERDRVGQKPGAIEHQLGIFGDSPSASDPEPPGPVNQQPGSSAHDAHPLDMLAAVNGKKRPNSRAAAGRIPQARLLFREVAEAPRTRWHGYVAGASGVLLVLAIAAGGYHYYRDELSPGLAVVEGGKQVTDAPSREMQTGDMGASSVVSMPPLVKDLPAVTREPPEPVPPVKATVARNEDEVPKAIPARPDLSSPAEEGSMTTHAAEAAAEGVAPDSASAAVSEPPRCPPAVVAMALCDWIAHADRN